VLRALTGNTPPASPASSGPPRWLPWAIVACGLLAIADSSGRLDAGRLSDACKPLTTLLILLHAALQPAADARLRRWVLAGLGVSVVAEAVMAAPSYYSVGLGSLLFVLAQACYLSAVLGRTQLARPGWLHLAQGLAAAWCIVMWSVAPRVTWVPIIVFMTVLSFTAAQAEVWWWRARGTDEAPLARHAALGGLLWMSADVLLTFSVHVSWVPGTFALVLPLYWLAQWNLASMVSRAGPTSRPPRP